MRLSKHLSLLAKDDYLAQIRSRLNRLKEQNPRLSEIDLCSIDDELFCHDFLARAIVQEYQKLGVNVAHDEIFVLGGIKSAMATFLSLFKKSTALIPNPYFPPYLESNIMAGNAVIFADCHEENGFLAMPERCEPNLIYICSPSNPTSAAYNLERLKRWVEHAYLTGAFILFDSSYGLFMESSDCPRSIFEVCGADKCAVEFCFRGRDFGCGHLIVPHKTGLSEPFRRVMSANCDPVPSVNQLLALSMLDSTNDGLCHFKNRLRAKRGKVINFLKDINAEFFCGVESEFVWLKCPCGVDSWSYFDQLLNEYGVLSAAGSLFGSLGDNYLRLFIR